ncbi:conjugal transfer mating-pair stabilization protein TraG [Citrobacter braakii]|uniref:conjugal transfer mating-pair stabilization protein TraG n=1 Tax=Citrobacter braakii TaxID=57706 RepID=UPI000CDD8921|nr:conjugal transfer mating-pair stabilization protein TraG [Citrobacter braakii]POT29259.1 conjugal transfer protein TraG [Citrobacter braakii]POT34118.1 conjugal transfer protein TraG [Citrobacter braakii]POT38943.1 conjugal transfer protein TraG [Citrobacter braakii]POU80486.1 conjugal transfer protein TraG [Citrobacter braakii]POV06462.1 conjugal transfer protein TraG [Citrobacter braakii]
MAVDTIYTVAGGTWFQDTLNGVAAFFNSRAGDSLIAMATAVSVIVGAATYIRTRNILDLVKWAGFYVLVIAVLVGDKRNVQIIDLSEPAAIYQVDNVPTGLAAPASLITRIGAGMAQVYDFVFARPDALTYSKTGMLFGAQLAAGSSDFRFSEPEIQRMFSDYVHNCVVGDIMLNNKYSIGELMNSTDPYALIFSKPSPLRGLYDKNRNFLTCEQATTKINTDSSDISGRNMSPFLQQVLNRMHGFTNQVFGPTNGASTALFTEMLGDSYNYFHGNSLTSTEIIRKNVVMNGLRSGLESFSAQNGDTAGLVNTATQTSMAKMRLSQATSASIAANTLPVMHSVLLGMTMALFPVLIVLAVVSSLSWTIIKGYIYTIAYLQMWPILFSILNHAMNFYLQGKLNGTAVTLATFDQVQNTYSDIGTTAGWLALSIPFIAWGMVKGLGQVVSQAGNYLGQTLQSASTQSSSQAVDGNWSYNNMTTGNVQGNKWDTNYSHREGHMTSQLESGATRTLTSSGQNVFDTTGAMSKLPVSLNGAEVTSSSLTQQARESEQRAQTALSGYQSGRTSSWTQLQQFASQRGNSDSFVQGSDQSTGSNASIGINKMLNATKTLAQTLGISETEAYNRLMDKSSRGTVSAGTKASAGAKLFGTGVEAHTGAELTGSTGSSHGTSETNAQTKDVRSDRTSQLAQDFREGLDIVKTSRVSAGGSHTDATSSNKLEQLSATLIDTQNSYQQYSDSLTRSHEYSEMAAYVQSNSAQVNSNFDQQFANYVMQKSGNAEAILSDTSSPEVAAERQKLAHSFVQDKMLPQIEAEYHGHKASLGSGMNNVMGTPGEESVVNHWNSNSNTIRDHENNAGIKENVPQIVEQSYVNSIHGLRGSEQDIAVSKEKIGESRDELQSQHQKTLDEHTQGMVNEKTSQKSLAGIDNDELTKMAQDAQERGSTYYGKK